MSGSVVAIIVALIGVSAGFAAIWQQRSARHTMQGLRERKVDAEAYTRAQTIMDAGMKELERRLERLQTALENAERRNELLEREVTDMREYIVSLREMMRAAGLTPPPTPPRPAP